MFDYTNSVLVVEGTSDVAFLQSFIDSNYVTTNGSEVSRETIELLKTLAISYPIIIMTDPDGPGRRIRAILEQEIPNISHVFLAKQDCIKGKKVGIAEANKLKVIEALEHIVQPSAVKKGHLIMSDLFELGLVGIAESSFIRDKVAGHYHLGPTNGKTLLKRLNQLNISRDQLSEVINDAYK